MSDDVPDHGLPDLATIEADLQAVDGALARLDDGTYGRCVVCGEPIGAADLEARPLLACCVEHDALEPAAPAAHEPVPQGPADDAGSPAAQTAWGSGGVASN